MKIVLIALTALAPMLCPAQDWRLTVTHNLVTDLKQTSRFDGYNVSEKNPLWKGVWKRSEWPLMFAAYQFGTALVIERQKDKRSWWALWGVASYFLVWSNHNFTGYGVPVLSWRF